MLHDCPFPHGQWYRKSKPGMYWTRRPKREYLAPEGQQP
ncbi:conserved hypothetical protein [Acidithiobacillus caldus SM-1]|uniref:Uncharacterized protein n=2 Tax=Acidithiobacillus caldus TaxID=33059 RepID=F9ZS73_ACICS|nr:conserved hypothetical protein [Acidithiobacillus caldus SM-1]AIA56100.1 hypothetical protein Acaty_c2246 [Acidithiobacillus caldus ATCC 51756]QER45991.1 hypothetical protein F0726_02945 [Acidithiobacillus caldus]